MGTWIDTTVRKGDIVNVLGLDETKSDWVINDLNGLLVINPDLLISGTSIVSTLFCMRKAVLNERFKASICTFLSLHNAIKVQITSHNIQHIRV